MGSKKSSSKSSKKGKKSKIQETKNDSIQDKPYVTRQIETSITLLESPETNIVLESLLFLSKYADIQPNNLNFLQSRGLLPKLLALLDHNICILRVSLRLLSVLLTTNLAQIEINQEKHDDSVLKMCKIYVETKDENIKEFLGLSLVIFSQLGRAELLLEEKMLIKSILKTVKNPENEKILISSLELILKFIETEMVRECLPREPDFNPLNFIEKMSISEECLSKILSIFEKITYFNDDALQIRLKECQLAQCIFNIIVDPEKEKYLIKCLNIIMHSMNNENTNKYFVETLEFLKFCHFVKLLLNEEAMQISIKILLELSKIDEIKQLLFDLSVEDSILSFFRSENKKILNATCEAVSNMTRHKFCCEKMLTPIVMKKLLQILQRKGDEDDPQNETALILLHYFCRRDTRTIHMIREYNGIPILMNFLQKGTEVISEFCFKRLLEIINMLVTSYQLKRSILCNDLFDFILFQAENKSEEIRLRSLEVLTNCLGEEDFRTHFLTNKGPKVVTDLLATENNDNILKMLAVFIHNSFAYEKIALAFIHQKLLLLLKNLPDRIAEKNPLFARIINLIYSYCLPMKFFETGRLELLDRISGRFYIINGPWSCPFPFLEVLEVRQMCTMATIYIIDDCIESDENELERLSSLSSTSSLTVSSINYGGLSSDPYLPKYVINVKKLLENVTDFKEKIKTLAKFVESQLCGPEENCTKLPDRFHTFKLHIECLKFKLGTNMIPIGFLRMGFHCERALLFKALSDAVRIPATLVKGRNNLYWNEIALIVPEARRSVLKMFVVDLMNRVGELLPCGSRECNAYCDIH